MCRFAIATFCLIVLTACGGAETAGVGGNGQPEGTAAKPGASRAVVPAGVSYADIRGIIKAIDDRKGRPVLLNFWATWCVPCIHEMPDLAKLAVEFGDGRADFIGVSLDAWISGDGSETEQKVREALQDAGVGYANLIYRGDQDPLVEEFDMSGAIPYTILYAPDGSPLRVWEGRVEIDLLRKALDDLS
jgi:thiol-disulfide isomerase/thioredoxin